MTSRYASVKRAGTKGGKETSRRIAARIREEQRIEEISFVSFVSEQWEDSVCILSDIVRVYILTLRSREAASRKPE